MGVDLSFSGDVLDDVEMQDRARGRRTRGAIATERSASFACDPDGRLGSAARRCGTPFADYALWGAKIMARVIA
jgi:hypothetical protein